MITRKDEEVTCKACMKIRRIPPYDIKEFEIIFDTIPSIIVKVQAMDENRALNKAMTWHRRKFRPTTISIKELNGETT